MVSFRFSQEVVNYVEHIVMVQYLLGINFQALGGKIMSFILHKIHADSMVIQ